MPVPETCAPAACADLSGAETVIVAPAQGPPLPPPGSPEAPLPVAATTAVSRFAPLSMVMVWPGLKPIPPVTGIKVAVTLAPGATGPGNVTEVSAVPRTTEVHCLGTEMLNFFPLGEQLQALVVDFFLFHAREAGGVGRFLARLFLFLRGLDGDVNCLLDPHLKRRKLRALHAGALGEVCSQKLPELPREKVAHSESGLDRPPFGNRFFNP
jgi:hypothetical protein